MVTCQSSELGWEVTVELPADFLSLGRGSVINVAIIIYPVLRINFAKIHTNNEVSLSITLLFYRMFSLVKKFH